MQGGRDLGQILSVTSGAISHCEGPVSLSCVFMAVPCPSSPAPSQHSQSCFPSHLSAPCSMYSHTSNDWLEPIMFREGSYSSKDVLFCFFTLLFSFYTWSPCS